jgi:hypothetical protein
MVLLARTVELGRGLIVVEYEALTRVGLLADQNGLPPMPDTRTVPARYPKTFTD